jgi:hypothetical protein
MGHRPDLTITRFRRRNARGRATRGQGFRGQVAPAAYFSGCMTKRFGAPSNPRNGAHEVLYGDD